MLFGLFLLFAAAKLAGEIFERLGQPEVVGEILAGLILGPHALGWVHSGEFLDAIAQLGVIVLLFSVGLETQVGDLRKSGIAATRIAVYGATLSMLFGVGIGHLAGMALTPSLFLGTAIAATSAGVTSRVLSDMGALSSRPGRLIVPAAVVDDILGLLIFAVVYGVGRGSVHWEYVVIALVSAVAFIAIVAIGGAYILREHPRILHRPQIKEGPFILALILCLGLSALASRIGLAAIIGAFIAGVIVAETREQNDIDQQIKPVYAFLVPFFFIVTGMKADISAFADMHLILVGLGITFLAIVGKVVGCGLGALREGKDVALAVGVGMVPRGEVGLIVAGIGLSQGILDARLCTVVVMVVIITTIVTPSLLKRCITRVTG